MNGNQVKLELGPDEKAQKREKIIDTLWAIQQKKGWIDDDSLKVAAAECGLSPSEADEVATFYNLLFRRPVGKRVLFVCDSISCHLTGADTLIKNLSAELGIAMGETTKDGEITMLPLVCLGHCDMAPCCQVGQTVHGPLKTDRAAAKELVAKIRG